MMQILYKLQIVNIIFTLSLYTESMKTINDNLNMYINDHLRMYTSDYALI